MKRSEIKRFPMADSVLESLEPEAKEYRVNDGAVFISVLSQTELKAGN